MVINEFQLLLVFTPTYKERQVPPGPDVKEMILQEP